MKPEDILDSPLIDTTSQPIYSVQAIRVFTFFFTSIFGGIMAYQNFNAVGKKELANKVLIGSILFAIAIFSIPVFIDLPSGIFLLINIGTAWFMGPYLHDTYISGHKEMHKRKIWIPSAIGLGIVLFILFIVFSGEIPDQQ